MDKESKEFSRLGLQVFSKEVSPEYNALRKQLLGSLAAHGASVEQLAMKDSNDRSNIELLTDFTKTLPAATADDHEWFFITDDPFRVRMIQANVIWVLHRPFYVLGEKAVGKKKELLLACAAKFPPKSRTRDNMQYGSIHRIDITRSNKKKIKTRDQIQISNYPSLDDVQQMFDQDQHMLVVHSCSPKSVNINPREWPRLTHLSDEELAAFDINSHLHRIAVAFSLETELDQLLVQHSDSVEN